MKLIRTVANIVAIEALTDMATGEVAIVPGDGIFRFDGASSATADGRWVVAPGSVGGRWIRLEHGLREVTDPTDLSTITGQADGDLVLATDIGRFGLYRWVAGDTRSQSDPWVIAPSSGSGRWYLVTDGLVTYTGGAGNNQIRLDPTKAPVPNRIVEIGEVSPASGSFAPSASSPGTVFGPTLTLSVEAGDIVEITGQIALVEDNAANLSVIMRSGTTVLGNGKAILQTTATLPVHITSKYVAPAAATLSIRFGGICSSATSVTYTEAGIIARIIRP